MTRSNTGSSTKKKVAKAILAILIALLLLGAGAIRIQNLLRA